MKILCATVFLVLLSGCVPSDAFAQTTTSYKVNLQTGVRVQMRDGVFLSADIYRPDSTEKFPVLLERTPYNRTDESAMANELASHGYIVVLQDTRGRYESGGVFYPFRNESSDGYDTVEWAANLDQSNGNVGMFGGSYVGATQMLAAMTHPPHLKSIFPYVTASEYYDGWTYQSGVLMQWFARRLCALLNRRNCSRSLSRWRKPNI
jgi:putative CocE/NonD family hydrolase